MTARFIQLSRAESSISSSNTKRDLAHYIFHRTLVNDDIGANAGQTQHEQGLLLVDLETSYPIHYMLSVRRIVEDSYYELQNFTNADTNLVKPSILISGKTIRLTDLGTGKLIVNDIIVLSVLASSTL